MRAWLIAVNVVAAVLAAPAADKVTSLPGTNFNVNFNHYSGYVAASSNKQFHYWFTESMVNASTAPLVLWLNGGPGCSSVGGLIEECGPFHVMDNANTVYLNQWSWNNFFNVIFLESPAGVGYSYDITGKVATNDDEVALNNHNALIDFLNKFPEYKGRDFYITGESYGGIYIPTLSARLVDDKTNFPNFKGVAIGNGYINIRSNFNTQPPLFYWHALVRDDLYNRLAKCCNGNTENCDYKKLETNPSCAVYVAQAITAADELDPYNLYNACYLDGDSESRRNFVDRVIRRRSGLPARKTRPVGDAYPPLCAQTSNTADYMNRADVRTALHIPSSLKKWTDCSNAVDAEYTTIHDDVTPEILKISAAGIRVLFYNGDVDTVCNHVMNKHFITNLNKTLQGRERVNEPWLYAKEDSPVAGFVEKYSDNIDFVTVRGSGHFVPEDKPREALQMLYNFIYQKPYSTAAPPHP